MFFVTYRPDQLEATRQGRDAGESVLHNRIAFGLLVRMRHAAILPPSRKPFGSVARATDVPAARGEKALAHLLDGLPAISGGAQKTADLCPVGLNLLL